MNIKLNDKTYDVKEGTTLSSFMNKLGIKPEGVAVAIHYNVVPKDKWNETLLLDNMELMLIQAVSGG